MKKATITLALLIVSLIGFSQNKTAKGKVLDINVRYPIPDAVVKVNDTSISTSTNDAGKFSIEVPKKFNTITIQHDDYLQKEIILKPGFQLRPLTIYLQ
ncbi:MAG TPA: carboxypeptidase-like regulatory domain-containing protein, partial [Bacteroidales bacterium]